MDWTLSQAARTLNPSAIREILKVTERSDVISFAGGLPAPETFPVPAFAEACARVLRDDGPAALQYAASEGFGPLREWIAARLPWPVAPSQVLVTTGSQQALDLLGKVLIDPGSRVLVEAPTYLGALQAFAPRAPRVEAVAGDDGGPDPTALEAVARGPERARFAYLLPNFQNPTGRTLDATRRLALLAAADRAGLPLVEANPSGELWFDAPPPPPLSAHRPEGCVYLGTFSKVLAPGLRLGYLVAPAALYPKLLQAKQAADLHTPGFNQRLAFEVVKDGLLDHHVPAIRARYRRHRDAMLAALARHMPAGTHWNQPEGGMFIWLRLPTGLDATALLPQAVARGVAYVPGAPFYAGQADARTLRLSFVTASPAQIEAGIAALAATVGDALAALPAPLREAA